MFNLMYLRYGVMALAVPVLFYVLYTWHYKPLSEYEDAKKIIIQKNREIKALEANKKTEVFESRWKAKKEDIKHEENTHEDINLSVGIHTIIFD